jgi:hypothetical protein
MSFGLPDLQYFGYEIKEWWERLAIRRWINRNPRLIMSVTAVSLLVLLVIVTWLLLPGKNIEVEQHEQEWFYDLNTGKLFTARSGQIPPIKAPSGPLPNGQPAGVRACVLAYADDPNDAERFIGFLETTDPTRQSDGARAAETNAGGIETWGKGKLIRRVEDKQWVPADSSEGQAILTEAFMPNENGERPHYCRPG